MQVCTYYGIICESFTNREEDDDDEHSELLQCNDPWEQSHQRHDDRQVRLQADPGLGDQLQVNPHN